MDVHRRDAAILISESAIFREAVKACIGDEADRIIEFDTVNDIVWEDRPGAEWVIWDVAEYGPDARAVVTALHVYLGSPKIIVISADGGFQAEDFSPSGGLSAFLPRQSSAQDIAQAVRLLRMQVRLMPARCLPDSGPTGSRLERGAPDAAGILSGREQEVLRLLAEGHSNKGIARHLDVSESTVRAHMRSILKKLNLSNRTQAAVWALNGGKSS